MNYRNFEKNIKAKLHDNEAELDINQFILDLHAKKDKSPRGLFLLIGLFCILCIPASFYFLSKKDAIHYNTNELSSVTTPNSFSRFGAAQSSSHNQSNEIKPVFVASHSSITNPNNIASFRQQTSTVKHNFYSAEKTNSILANNDVKTNSFTTPINTIDISALSEAVTSSKVPNTTMDELNNSIVYTETKIVNSESLANENNTKSIDAISYLPIINSKVKSANIVINEAYTKDVKCPSFVKKSPYRFSIIPEIGYFRPIKSLTNTASEPSEIFTLRDKNEQTLEGLQAALYLQVQKNSSPFYFRAGINYAQLTEKMKLDYTYIMRDTTIGVVSTTISQTGDTITTIYGEIITEIQRQGTRIGHHKFQLYDIPLSIGYEKSFHGFTLGAEIGASLNVSMVASGKMLGKSTENGIVFKDVALNSPYKTNLGLNYFGSVAISKEIAENQSVYVALRGRFIPSNFTQSMTIVTEKYSFAGLHLGYKIGF